MESLGMLMAMAGGAVAAPVYCWSLVTFVLPFPLFARFILRVAAVMVVLALIEMASVYLFGAIAVRHALGAGFIWLHMALTFPLPAMLCAVLLLSGRVRSSRWPLVALAGWLVGACVIDLQDNVAFTLYGPDGEGGPYSDEGTMAI